MASLPPVTAELTTNVSQAVDGISLFRRELATLEETFTAVRAAAAAVDGALEKTGETAIAAREGFTALGQESTTLGERFAAARSEVSGMSTSVSGLSRSTQTLNDRLAASEAAAGSFADRFSTAETSMTGFADRVTALGAEMTALKGSLAEAAASMKLLADSADRAAVSQKKVELASAAARTSMSEMRSSLLMVGAAFGITDFEVVKMAGNVQANLIRLRTEAGLSEQQINQFAGSIQGLQDKVIQVGDATGTSAVEISNALYEPVSAGLSLSQALDAVKYSAEEAKISGASLEDTTTGLTAIMKSFGDTIPTPEQGMASLNAIVGQGMMRFQDFDQSIKNWAPTAATFGVSLDSVGAALAYMTDRGESAQTAGTKVAQVMAMLVGQTSQAGKLMQALGLSTDDVATSNDAMSEAMSKAHITTSTLAEDLRKPDGLQVALSDLKTHLEDAGLSADAADSVLVRAFGGGKQFKGLAELIQNLDQLKGKFEQIQNDENVNHFEEQWNLVSTSFNQRLADMIASVKNLGIAFGTEILPAAGRVLSVFGNLFDGISHNKAAVDALSVGFGVLAVALPIAAAGMFVAKMSETAIAVTTTTLKVGLLSAALDFGLTHLNSWQGITVTVVAGLAALATAGQLLGPVFSAVKSGIQTAGTAIGVFALEVAEAEGVVATMGAIGSGVIEFLTGPWGLALGVAAGAIALFASTTDKASGAVDDLTKAIEQDSGALGKNSAQWAAHKLETEGALSSAKDFGLSAADLTQAVMGQGNALDSVRSKLQTVIDASKTYTTDEVTGTQEWTGALTGNGQAAQKLLDVINNTRGSVQSSLESYNRQQDALSGVAGKSGAAAQAQNDLNGAVQKVSGALDDAKRAASQLSDQLELLNGGNLSAEKTLISFRDQVDSLTKSFADNGKTLDDNTEKGRKNVDAVLSAIDAANQHASAVAKQTGSTQRGTEAFQSDIAALRDHLAQVGLDKAAIDKLIDTYAKVPENKSTDVQVNSEEAQRRADNLLASINAIRSKEVYVDVVYQEVGRPTHGAFAKGGWAHLATGGIPHFPGGGQISGPGTTSSDSIPAMLSDQEYVIKADAVAKIGVPVLDAINAGDLVGAYDLLLTKPGPQGGDGSALYAPNAARGGDTIVVNNHYVVNVNNAGSVIAERDLAERIQQQMTQIGGRRSTSWQNYVR